MVTEMIRNGEDEELAKESAGSVYVGKWSSSLTSNKETEPSETPAGLDTVCHRASVFTLPRVDNMSTLFRLTPQ